MTDVSWSGNHLATPNQLSFISSLLVERRELSKFSKTYTRLTKSEAVKLIGHLKEIRKQKGIVETSAMVLVHVPVSTEDGVKIILTLLPRKEKRRVTEVPFTMSDYVDDDSQENKNDPWKVEGDTAKGVWAEDLTRD